METIHIYTDGACSGNPGPGGWAAAIKRKDGKKKASCGYIAYATNNSAELIAALEAVKRVKRTSVINIYTDSNYLISNWRHDEEWLLSEGHKNRELWFELIQLAKDKKHTINFIKVNGHSGDEMNDLVDKLARAEIVKARHQL